ncbi:hypothetical protein D3C85_865040 [compost metagenome]
MAKVGLGEEADLVVVVEHHPAVTGNAEVLQQHVAGKDVGRRQLLDRQPIVFQGLAHLRLVGVLQVEVQRGHPALGPAVADQHRIALHLHRGGGNLQ